MTFWRTQSDALAFRFQMEGVAGSELQAVTNGLGQNDAAGFIEGELGGHDGSMVWEKPIVNGIWQKNERKPVQERKMASGAGKSQIEIRNLPNWEWGSSIDYAQCQRPAGMVYK